MAARVLRNSWQGLKRVRPYGWGDAAALLTRQPRPSPAATLERMRCHPHNPDRSCECKHRASSFCVEEALARAHCCIDTEPTKGWACVHHERQVLGRGQARAPDFQHASSVLLDWQYFPPTVARCVRQWRVEGRDVAQSGDQFAQRVSLLPFLPVRFGLDHLSVDQVTRVVRQPRRCGIVITTTDYHDEIGEHTSLLHWRKDDSLWLEVVSVSTFPPSLLSPFLHTYGRWLQRRAHRIGMQHVVETCVSRINQSRHHSFSTKR